MKNNLAVNKKQKKTTVGDFLTEEEIRDIIRKRLIKETQNRLGPIKYSVLVSEPVGNNNLTTLNEVVTPEDLIGFIQGQNAATAEMALKAVAALITTLISAGAIYGVAVTPFVPLWAKAIMVASIAAAGWYSYTKLSEIITKYTVLSSWDLLFLTDEQNPINKMLIELKGEIDQGFTSAGGIKMPALNPPPSYDPNANPAACQAELEAYINTNHGSVTDFLGIPQANFSKHNDPQSPPAASNHTASRAFGFGHRHVKCARIGYDMANELIRGKAQGDMDWTESKVMKILVTATQDPEFTLYDLQWIDYYFGKLIMDSFNNNRITSDGSKARTDTTEIPCAYASSIWGTRSDHLFMQDRSFIENTVLNSPAKSNIIGCFEQLNTYGNKLAQAIPLPSSIVPGDPTDSQYWNEKMRNMLGDITVFHKKKLFMLKADLSDGGVIDPYLLGMDWSSTAGAHCIPHSNSSHTSIGVGFFAALKPSLSDKIKQFFVDLWNKFKQAIVDAWNWTVDKVNRFWNWLQPYLVNFWTALTAGAVALWEWIKELAIGFWEWLTGDEEEEQGQGRRASSRGGGRYRPEVEEMQRIMNKINNEKNLGGEEIAVDGYWGPETDGMWELVTNYGFSDGVLQDDPDAGTYDDDFHSWNPMSRKLRDDQGTNYPGYTADSQGALNIVKDIDIGDTVNGLGRSRSGEEDFGDDRRSVQREEPPLEEPEDLSTPKPTRGGVGVRGIKVRVDAGNNQYKTFESLGFPEGTTRNVTEDILASIRDENFTGTGEEGIQLKVPITRKGKVANVRWVVIGKTSNFLETFPYFNSLAGKIKDTLKSTPPVPELRDRVSSFRGRAFTISITVPPGVKRQR